MALKRNPKAGDRREQKGDEKRVVRIE